MLPVDIQKHSSRCKCFKSSWQHFVVLRPTNPLLAYPRSSSKSSLWYTRQNQRDWKQKNWHNPSSFEGLAFSICQQRWQAGYSVSATKHHSRPLTVMESDCGTPRCANGESRFTHTTISCASQVEKCYPMPSFQMCAVRERQKEDEVTPCSCLLQRTGRRSDSVHT